MPIFLDRHDVVKFSAEEVAKLHVKDLEVQGKYGVKFLIGTMLNVERHSVWWMHQTRRQPTRSMQRPTDTWPTK
jgi:hypothetical protein